jgi:large subunit ribosomal protein L9
LASFVRVGDTEHLYGSVTTADLAEALAAKGLEIDRKRIHLDEPLKALGEFTVPVKLHREVTAQLKVHVLASVEPVRADRAHRGIVAEGGLNSGTR